MQTIMISKEDEKMILDELNLNDVLKANYRLKAIIDNDEIIYTELEPI